MFDCEIEKGVMDSKDKRNAIIHWASKYESIQHVVLTGTRVNNAAIKTPFLEYQWILSISDIKFIDELDWEKILPTKLIQTGKFIRNGVSFVRLFYDDFTRFDIEIVSKEELVERIKNDTLCDILLDKDHTFGASGRPTDISRRIKKPTNEKFQSWFNSFFSYMTDVCIYLRNDSYIAAQYAFQDARIPLLKMVEASVAANSDFSVNLGYNGQNLKAYMDQETYNHFTRTFSSMRFDTLWDAVFQACMVFRKEGLHLAEVCGYEYPKETDVRILRKFRELWGDTV